MPTKRPKTKMIKRGGKTYSARLVDQVSNNEQYEKKKKTLQKKGNWVAKSEWKDSTGAGKTIGVFAKKKEGAIRKRRKR